MPSPRSGCGTDMGSRPGTQRCGPRAADSGGPVDSGTGATLLTVAGEVDMLAALLVRQRLEENLDADRRRS